MLLKKKGFPEVDELVFCTVTSVQSHSVFVRLEEYGSSGMIHISEVSPGRIRNIRDFVIENKTVVCKVIGINMERGHIDLSLRRVNEGQRRAKINSIKQEQKAEKIVELVAKQLSMQPQQLYEQVYQGVSDRFGSVFEAFLALSKGELAVSGLGLPKEAAEPLADAVMQRIKPPVVEVKGKLSVRSYEPDGVSAVRAALKEAVKAGADVSYLGAGTYLLKVSAENYKSAEAILSGASSAAVASILRGEGEASFVKG